MVVGRVVPAAGMECIATWDGRYTLHTQRQGGRYCSATIMVQYLSCGTVKTT